VSFGAFANLQSSKEWMFAYDRQVAEPNIGLIIDEFCLLILLNVACK